MMCPFEIRNENNPGTSCSSSTGTVQQPVNSYLNITRVQKKQPMLLCWGCTAALTFVTLRSVFARVWAELAAQALKRLRANTSAVSTQAIHALWYGREVIVTYEFKQVFTLEKRLYTCPYFVTLIDSQEEPQLCWKRCFKAKTVLMLFLCCHIFYLCIFCVRIVSWVITLRCAN